MKAGTVSLVAVALSILVSNGAVAATVYETSSGTIWAGGGGPLINFASYHGTSFVVNSETVVTAVGGSIISGYQPDIVGSIFAAIVPIAANRSLPSFNMAAIQTHALAGASFTPQTANESPFSVVAMDLVLQPGRYALIFGGGRENITGPFGANGSAVLVGLQDPGISNPFYVVGSRGWEGTGWLGGNADGYEAPYGCSTATNNCIRYAVFGTGSASQLIAMTEPAPALLLALGACCLAVMRRFRGSKAP